MELWQNCVFGIIGIMGWGWIRNTIYDKRSHFYYSHFNFFLPASNPDSRNRSWCWLPHWPGVERGLRVGDTDRLQAHSLRRPHVGGSRVPLGVVSMTVVWLTTVGTKTCPELPGSKPAIRTGLEVWTQLCLCSCCISRLDFFNRAGLALVKDVAVSGAQIKL